MGIFQQVSTAVKEVVGNWSRFGESQDSSFMSVANWFRNTVNKKKLTYEYKNLVYSCVRVIAQDTARYEPFVYKEIVNGQPKPIKDHPLMKLIQNPNPEMSQYELFEGIQTYIELTGEAFVYVMIGQVQKKPIRINGIIRPDKITVAQDEKTGELLGYVYHLNNGKKVPLDVDEIWHFKAFNPKDQSRGLGAVEAGILYVDIENETSLFQWGVLKNQASPAGVLSLKGKIGRDAFKKLKAQWRESYAGTSNAGKTLFIRESDATFTKVGLSLTDLQISDLSRVNDEKIRKLFGIPREMLGDTSNSGLGRANIEAIEYVYAKRTIDPKYVRFDDQLTTLLRRYYGETDTRVSHYSHIPKDEASILAENTASVDRWMTRNEIRRQKGLPDVPGGDVLYTSFSNIPIESQQTAETPQKPVANMIVLKSEDVHVHKHEEKPMAKSRKRFFKVLDKIEVRSGKQYSGGLNDLLKDQEKKVKELVERFLAKGAKKGVDFDGTMFKLTFTDSEIELNLLTWLLNAFMRSGAATLESLGKPDADFILRQAQRDAIFNSTERLMRSFNEETSLKLQQQLAQGLANGESVEDVQKRVESIYDDAKGYRSKRIADTEVHKAVNNATAEVYKQEGYTSLKWEANPGACEFCMAMDGQTVEMDQPFVREGSTVTGEDGGEYQNDYADVKYADLHPNCKCRLVPQK